MGGGAEFITSARCDECGEGWPAFVLSLDVEGCPDCSPDAWQAIGPTV